jgi:hypothetical protein
MRLTGEGEQPAHDRVVGVREEARVLACDGVVEACLVNELHNEYTGKPGLTVGEELVLLAVPDEDERACADVPILLLLNVLPAAAGAPVPFNCVQSRLHGTKKGVRETSIVGAMELENPDGGFRYRPSLSARSQADREACARRVTVSSGWSAGRRSGYVAAMMSRRTAAICGGGRLLKVRGEGQGAGKRSRQSGS